MRLLGFHALHQDLTGTVSVFVDPRFEASVHCFIESPFIFPADEHVPITDCWLTRNQFGLVEATADTSATIFFDVFSTSGSAFV
jgi:hypothetical protein